MNSIFFIAALLFVSVSSYPHHQEGHYGHEIESVHGEHHDHHYGPEEHQPHHEEHHGHHDEHKGHKEKTVYVYVEKPVIREKIVEVPVIRKEYIPVVKKEYVHVVPVEEHKHQDWHHDKHDWHQGH